MEQAHKENTVLPHTCGEETDLPGVPAVGCVASVHYRPNQLRSVAAVITASCDAIHILGPDLAKRDSPRREHCLFTRTIWRIPAQQRGGGAVSEKASTGTGATITSLVGFLVAPQRTVRTSGTWMMQPQTTLTTDLLLPVDDEEALDTVCVCVSWIDVRGGHRVSSIFFSLLAALTQSRSGGADALAVKVHTDVLPPFWTAQGGGGILRLFHHPRFVRESHPTTDPAATREGSTPQDGASRSSFRHIVMCSCYQLADRLHLAAESTIPGEQQHSSLPIGHDEREGAASSKSVSVANPEVASPPVGDAEAAMPRVRAAPLAASSLPGRKGWLTFIKVDWACVAGSYGEGEANYAQTAAAHGEAWVDDSGADASGKDGSDTALSVPHAAGGSNSSPSTCTSVSVATESDVAPWLWRFQPGRVVVSFSVQNARAPIIAAAGTADGRILLLAANTDRTVRRLVGPISDIGFVDMQPSHRNIWARSKLIDAVLQEQTPGDTPTPERTGEAAPSASLVALDVAGNVVVLQGINTATPVSQMVADIPQLITLKSSDGATTTSFVDATAAAGQGSSPTAAKSFLDLSTLRRFFSPLAAKTKRASPSGKSSTTATTAGEADEFHLSGHLLSRGLLYGTWVASTRGGPELVVSTLGQAIVSIPYDPDEGNFAIAGFTMTPTPMNYIGFLDFFNTGVPELVMTSPHSVLVARSSRDVLHARTALLARLLQKRAAEAAAQHPPHASKEPDDYADLLET